jgi:hypothetical protein
MANDICGLPQLPDVGAWLDQLSKLFDRAEGLLVLLLIIVLVLVIGLIISTLLSGRRRR